MDDPAPHRRPAPLAAEQRSESLDVLRGFGVLGIALVNIWSFALPPAFLANPHALGPLEGLDRLIWTATHLLVVGKFHTIFAALFGAGIVITLERSGSAVHARRMFWLLVFGLLHAYLLWPGDILVTYALCGLLVAGLARRRALTLVLIGFSLIGLGAVFNFLFLLPLLDATPDTLAAIERASWTPTPQMLDAEIALRRDGGWAVQIGANGSEALTQQTYGFLVVHGWRFSGIMALGMALYRVGFLTGRLSASAYALTALAGFGFGLPVVYGGILYNDAQDWAFLPALLVGDLYNYFASLPVAAGWAGAILWLVRSGGLASLRRCLAAAGRMAFTNYIMQSVLAVGLMYGVGLGLYASLSLADLLGIVLAIWVVQILWSLAWLARYRHGPLEALWRYLVYGPEHRQRG